MTTAEMARALRITEAAAYWRRKHWPPERWFEPPREYGREKPPAPKVARPRAQSLVSQLAQKAGITRRAMAYRMKRWPMDLWLKGAESS
jgi:hypothetical protein